MQGEVTQGNGLYKKLENLVLCLFSFAVVVLIGLNYGFGNQCVYFIDGFAKIFPGFLADDWFTYNTKHYHEHFSYILVFLHNLGSYLGFSLKAGVVFVDILLRLCIVATIYRMVVIINRKNTAFIFFLLLFIITLEKTTSIGTTYILSKVLQPSSFSTIFLLVGSYFFIRGRYSISGLWLAFAGYMHTNFLVLIFIFFGMAHLFIGKQNFVQRVVKQFSWMLVPLLIELPFLLHVLDQGERGGTILEHIRSPHHYIPATFAFDYLLFIGWLLLGLWGILCRKNKTSFEQHLCILYFAFSFLVLLGTFFTTVVFSSTLCKMCLIRFAPEAVLFAQILFLSALFQEEKLVIRNPINLLLGIGFLCIIGWYLASNHILSAKFVFLLAFIGIILGVLERAYLDRGFSLASEKMVFTATWGLVGAFILYSFYASFYQRSTLISNFPTQAQTGLYEWAKTTDHTSRFVVPPNLENFRFYGTRPIIVDWKGVPGSPEEVAEWYQRIRDISGTEPKSIAEAVAGYAQMDEARIQYLKDKYQIKYAVFYYQQHPSWKRTVAFQNERFIVFKLSN